jgi:hypothetical protein
MTQALDQEGIANWRSNWLRLIAHLSNIELQRERWLNPAAYPSPYWSFTEFFCMYFDDLGLGAGYEDLVASGNVTTAEATILKDLHAGLSAYDSPTGDDHDHAAILADPKWAAVVSLAAQAREQLQELPLSEPDLRAIRDAG